MKYKLQNIKIFGYHGVYEDEIKNGQYFIVNLSYELNFSKKKSDNINDVVDYKKVYCELINLFNVQRYNLIESLAISITKELKNIFKMNSIFIEIIRNNPSTLKDIKSISVTYEE